ncbi:hypothetical protein [Streptomyces sp. NPDC046909]|uniref:hypothetical protein n=1 Tax=Streptomyces sp. NPDC046909 TaxID=3155617 RepID=UPI0033CF099F
MTTRTAEQKPFLSVAAPRAALDATRGDQLLYAGTSLLLLAGLRRDEATRLLVGDWSPGAYPQVRILGRQKRMIRVATTAAAAVDACLDGVEVEAEEPLLLGLKTAENPFQMSRLFRLRMRECGLNLNVYDLRRAAIAVVINSGTPLAHIEAYFGLSKVATSKQLVPVPGGYDRDIAILLEETFAP